MASIEGYTEEQNAQLAGAQVGQLIFIQQFNVPAQFEESDDEHDDDFAAEPEESADEDGDESDDEHASSPQDDDGESSEQAGEEDGEGTDDTSLEESSTCLPTMYVVSGVTKTEQAGITDLRITALAYADKVGGSHTYHIYGTACQTDHSTSCGVDCKDAKSIKDIADSKGLFFSLAPSGDMVRRHIATNTTRQCIANCRKGFLDNIHSLPGMIENYDAPTLSWGDALPGYLQPPVCPVCMGTDLLKVQQDLQINVLNAGQLGTMALMGDAAQFHGDLAQRWSALGYRYKQFDEREWGFFFNDMLSDADAEYDQDDDGRFEHWDEAMDPSSNAPLRPASESTIAELPRKMFKDVAQDLEATICMICQEELQDETTMVELPCGHMEFCEECVTKWLKNYDNCPKCRAKVLSLGGEQEPDNIQQTTASASAPRAPTRPHIPGDDHYSSINGVGMSGESALAAAIAASMAPPAVSAGPAPHVNPDVDADDTHAPSVTEMDGEDAVMTDL